MNRNWSKIKSYSTREKSPGTRPNFGKAMAESLEEIQFLGFMAVAAPLNQKKKTEEEAKEAIQSGNKRKIEAFQSSMDEEKISALIRVSIWLESIMKQACK